MSDPRARIALTADPSTLDAGLARGRGKVNSWGRDAVRSLTSVGRALTGVMGRGLSMAGLDPRQLLSQGADEAKDFEDRMVSLAIAQHKGNDEMDDFRRQVTAVSADTAVARNEIMAGVGAYQDITGDTKGATVAMASFAHVAQATKSSMEDVASAGAALHDQMGIDPADFEKAFDILNEQAKAGSVTLRDAAGEFSELAASFKRFSGGTGVGGLKQMAAAVQVVQKSFGNDAKAGATGFSALMTALVKNADKLEKAGAKIFADKGHKHLKSFTEIIDAIGHSKVLQDQTLLQKALGRDEAVKAYNALKDYRGLFDQLADSESAAGSIERDRMQRDASDAGKLEKAYNDVKLAVAKAFTPDRIEAFANAVGKVAGLIGSVADGLSKVEEFAAHLAGDNNNVVPTDALATADAKDLAAGKKVDWASGANANADASIGEVFNAGLRGEELYSFGKMGERALAAHQERKFNEARKTQQALVQTGGIELLNSEYGRQTPGLLESYAAGQSPLRTPAVDKPVTVNVQLKVDGNTIATAAANAPANRTSPGGR